MEDLATMKYPIVAWGGPRDRPGSRPSPRSDRDPKCKRGGQGCRSIYDYMVDLYGSFAAGCNRELVQAVVVQVVRAKVVHY